MGYGGPLSLESACPLDRTFLQTESQAINTSSFLLEVAVSTIQFWFLTLHDRHQPHSFPGLSPEKSG